MYQTHYQLTQKTVDRVFPKSFTIKEITNPQ